MELISYLIGFIFGIKQDVPVVIEPQPTPIVFASSTKFEAITFTITKKKDAIRAVIKPNMASLVTANQTESVATETKPIETPITFVVSEPIIEYNVSTTQITEPLMEEVTITEPTFELNQKPNSSKYFGTFEVSNTSKKVTMVYNGTSTSGTTVKGGFEFQPSQPYEIYWEDIGTFDYTINYNNGEVTKTGQFTVAE